MNEFDPHFDQTARAKPDHECIFVQSNSPRFEVCSIPGCSQGRFSRQWIANLKSAHEPPAQAH